MSDVGVHRRAVGEQTHDRVERVRQVGEQTRLDDVGDLGQVLGRRGAVGGLRRRRGDHRGAPDRRLDQTDRELRLPVERPGLAERPGAARAAERAPADPQDVEAVQEFGLVGVVGLAQVEFGLGLAGLRREPQPLLLPRQIGGQRDPVPDQRHLRVVAAAEH